MRRAKSKFRHNVEQAVVSRIAWLVSRLARRMSLRSARRLADAVAGLIMLLFPSRQKLADQNISVAFPTMNRGERKTLRTGAVHNICRTMIELLKLPSYSPEQLAELVRLKDFEHLREAARGGGGIIAVTGHFGNWEWLGARLAQEVQPTAVIARDAPHSLTASLINEARASHGMMVLGRDDLRAMLGILRQGGLLGILPDQHASEGGVQVDFMGRPAWTFTGPALIAMRTGARVFPIFCPRLPDGSFELQVRPEVQIVNTGDRNADILANTQAITAAIEEGIRTCPEQWLWLHNRWKKLAEQ